MVLKPSQHVLSSVRSALSASSAPSSSVATSHGLRFGWERLLIRFPIQRHPSPPGAIRGRTDAALVMPTMPGFAFWIAESLFPPVANIWQQSFFSIFVLRCGCYKSCSIFSQKWNISSVYCVPQLSFCPNSWR